MVKSRVALIGLDCAVPELVFGKWLGDLPHIRKLIGAGVYGELRSTIPPITVPAWTSMFSSANPGRLGFYGFRNRKDYSYEGTTLAFSSMVKEKRVWDILSEAGKKCIVLGVPQTYPVSPVNGYLVSCFLTPSIESQYTYPDSLKNDIARWVGEYMIDVDNFRTDDKDRLIRDIYAMTDKRFEVAKRLLSRDEWDFFAMVEMGPDRIQHGFWHYMDEEHVLHEPNSPYKEAIRDYYIYLDRKVGELLELFPDDTLVMVTSDHGAKRMDGGICLNEWLIQEGYLVLRDVPRKVTPFSKVEVDWPRTRAWGDGGYYGRLFLNVKGREPEGTVEPDDYERMRDELTAKLRALTDEQGRNLGTKVFKPQEVYGVAKGVPPDLIVYFGDLYWRSIGSVGHGKIWSYENDSGPDGANHSEYGIFVMAKAGDTRPKRSWLGKRKMPNSGGRRLEGLDIVDVAPTILSCMGLPVPPDMEGKPITL